VHKPHFTRVIEEVAAENGAGFPDRLSKWRDSGAIIDMPL
jgi:hypothetical protein